MVRTQSRFLERWFVGTFICVGLCSVVLVSTSSAKTGSLRLGSAQQGIDGSCDFGYGASEVDAIDTMVKYFDRISPYADCGAEGNPLKSKNPNLNLLQYISIFDMPPDYPSNWATSGPFQSSRKVGWISDYLKKKYAWNADKLEKLYLHFYDNTTFLSGGVLKSIPGCFKDSAHITAADSVSRVPNSYARSAGYWSGNTYSGVTRLFPNFTSREVREAMNAYMVIACTATTGGSANFWPGKNYVFNGVFFDNSGDIGVALPVSSGGHIVESFDVSTGSIATDISQMVLSSATTGSYIPANRTAFDIWWWDENMKPYLMSLDTLLDTLHTPNGYRPRYMLNCGFGDQPDHYHDPQLMEHDILLEWGGVGNRGVSNSLYKGSAAAYAQSFASQVSRDSISALRGNTRQVWVHNTVGNYTGSISPSEGGGTQSWHDGWKNTLIMFLVMNGDSTYYDMWDSHIAYYGSANPTAATSAFDSLHFGSQGAMNLRGILSRDLGSKLSTRPTIFATGTIDGDAFEVWGRRYAGTALNPNGWLVLFRERSCGSCEFMSNSTPATIALGGSYKILQNDNSLTTGTVTSVSLRAGEGVVLYTSSSTPNNPPAAPAPVSPVNGANTSVTPTLTCNKAVDLDNPASLTYRFQVSTAPSFGSIVSQGTVVSGGSTASWTVPTALSNATAYYWRVRAYDFADSSSWSVTNNFLTGTVVNQPPAAPTLISPISSATVTTAPTLSCNKATDPDNSTLSYTFQVSNTSSFGVIAAQVTLSSANATIAWNVTPTLQAATNYWWRVNASDGQATSGWSSSGSFVTQAAANTAPTTPALLAPANNSTDNKPSPTLTIQNSTDSEGNTLVYHFQVYNSAGTTLMSEITSVAQGTGTTTSWTVPIAIASGVKITWRARAYDGLAYSPFSGFFGYTYSSTVSGGNSGPTNGNRRKPAKKAQVIGQPILFEWDNGFDPNVGDQLGYDLYIMTDSVGGTDVDSVRNILQVNGSAITSRLVNSSRLLNGRVYWWTIRTNDGQIWTSRAPGWSFTYFDLASGTNDGQATTVYPVDGTEVRSSHPTLVAKNILLSGNNYYYFDVAIDSFFANIAALSQPVPQSLSGETSWTIDSTLSSGINYYWRVRANSNEYSPTSSFTVDPAPHASPVPFKPATDGVLTFHELPDGSDLVIMATSGQVVLRRHNITGGTWFWDGKNGQNSPVASGVYLWFIDGTDLKGKLVVQR